MYGSVSYNIFVTTRQSLHSDSTKSSVANASLFFVLSMVSETDWGCENTVMLKINVIMAAAYLIFFVMAFVYYKQ
jgi:hypothetical protein